MAGDEYYGFDLQQRKTLENLGVVPGNDGTSIAELVAASTAISNGTALTGSVTFDPPSLGDGAGTTTTVTVTGAVPGDFALVSFSLDLQGIAVTAYVSVPDTVSVRFQNETTGTVDLASGTLRARVLQV